MKCPKCGVDLKYIFANPEVKKAYSISSGHELVCIEEVIEMHRDTVIPGPLSARERLLNDSKSCPRCNGLLASVSYGTVPARILHRHIEPDEVGLVLA